MQQPEGFVSNPSLVYRLKKSLYGIKQSPKAWYANIDGFLLSLSFVRCNSDMYDNYELISDPNIPTRPKWVEMTIHAAGELVGNPNDTRRIRSQFESSLSVKDPIFAKNLYMMVESDPYIC